MRPILYFAILVILSGCYSLNPNIMFRTNSSYPYAKFNDSLVASKGYKIAPNDVIDLKIYTNDGFKLIDVTSVSANTGGTTRSLGGAADYIVEYDGYAKLPVLGKTMLSGLTVRQAELMLEEKFSTIYVKPFIMLKVTNKRIIVFPGSPGDARVLMLSNNNTKLIEAIAQIGGLPSTGISKKIKIIRGNLQNPDIYLIDLSTIEGLKKADMVMQANDIIYVETRRHIPAKISQSIAPWLGIISTLSLAYALFGKIIQ